MTPLFKLFIVLSLAFVSFMSFGTYPALSGVFFVLACLGAGFIVVDFMVIIKDEKEDRNE